MALQQDPDWPLINFKITPDATFNPFHYEDPKVDELIATIQTRHRSRRCGRATKELNTYIVDQAWFAPWYRVAVNYVTDPNTKVTVAQAATPTRTCGTSCRRPPDTSLTCGRVAPERRPRPSSVHEVTAAPSGGQQRNNDAEFILRRLLAGIVLIFAISSLAFVLLYAGAVTSAAGSSVSRPPRRT